MRIGKISSGAEYRMDEQLLKLIFEILVVFQIEKKIWIPIISNLDIFQIAIIDWFEQ